MIGQSITLADFYMACEKFFPEHDIVFSKCLYRVLGGEIHFTDCLVNGKLVLRYCPHSNYDCPSHIVLFSSHLEEPMELWLDIDVDVILQNMKEQYGDIC